MKRFAMLGLAIALVVCGVFAQSSPPAASPAAPPAPTASASTAATDHAWLRQIVGEWDATFKMYIEPGQPPLETTGTDSVRMLGEHWIIAETKTTMMEVPYRGMLLLGYDEMKKLFNGTWIDSMGGHLWVYKGTLNDTGDAMTLMTEGPSLEAADKTARYKETIQITGKDRRTFTSTSERQDGTWMKLIEIEYRRKSS